MLSWAFDWRGDGRRTVPDNRSDVPATGEAEERKTSGGGPATVTIAYIAESAGVSVPTVSKVLNGRSGVSDETRSRVEELILRYGYRKPPKNRSNLVELVFRELESMWAVEIIRGVERAARRNKVSVLVSEFGLQDAPARTIDDTVERRPRCVLSVAWLSEEERDQLQAKGIPFVVFDPNRELPDGVPFVGATNFRGGQAATRHLIELGHRRIGLITGPDHPFCLARTAGYCSALIEAGLPVEPDLMVKTLLTREDGCVAARDLLSRPDRPTAVFTANDMQALGVYRAARELGLRVPDDLSVVGFDDVPAVAWADPPLTTVHQPLADMAVAATELALALGRGDDVPQVGLEIATSLTVRESTAPPKG
jgi:DNA-binding LacI/PurR family transcriptional regulator